MKEQLPITEEIDFHYLLQLMPVLHDVDSFHLLPELFSTIGIESFLLLCKYAGGETITVPTLEELSESIMALQWFYDVYITNKKEESFIPDRLVKLVSTIREVFEC